LANAKSDSDPNDREQLTTDTSDNFRSHATTISIVLHALLVFHAWLVITNLQDGQQRTAHIGHSL